MQNIFNDVREKGYVVFNLKDSDKPNYCPGVFNKYPGVNIHELKIYDLITIKVFVADGDGDDLPRITDGHIDLTIESIEGDSRFDVPCNRLSVWRINVSLYCLDQSASGSRVSVEVV